MTHSVTFPPHRTDHAACGDETTEVAESKSSPVTGDASSPESARPPVIALVQNDDERHALRPEAIAHAMDRAVARSPVRLAEVEDFNVTQLSMRALEDDVRDADEVDEQPLLLDVHVDPAGLDYEIGLARLRRIVSDRSNPIDVIRLLGPYEAT